MSMGENGSEVAPYGIPYQMHVLLVGVVDA